MSDVVVDAISIVSAWTVLDAVQFCWYFAHVGGLAEVSELVDGLLEVDAVCSAIEEVSYRRILLRHRLLINRFLKALNQAPDHIFLTDHSSFHVNSRPLCPSPYFHHSSLVDADVVALHRKAAHEPCQVVVASQRLVVKMQCVWIGNIMKIA